MAKTKPLITITIEGEDGSGKAYVAAYIHKTINQEFSFFKARMIDKSNDHLLIFENPEGDCMIQITVQRPQPLITTGFVPVSKVEDLIRDAWEMGSAYGDIESVPEAKEAYDNWINQQFNK